MRPDELIRLRRGTDAAAGSRRVPARGFVKSRMKRCWKPSRKNCRAALGLAPGTRHPGLRFGPQGAFMPANHAGRSRRDARSAARLANDRLKELAAQSGHARDRQRSRCSGATLPPAWDRWIGRPSIPLESCRSSAHGAGSGARHRTLNRNASRQQFSDSLLNSAPFRRRPGPARRKDRPERARVEGTKPSAPSKKLER